jgi:hypothetical protein
MPVAVERLLQHESISLCNCPGARHRICSAGKRLLVWPWWAQLVRAAATGCRRLCRARRRLLVGRALVSPSVASVGLARARLEPKLVATQLRPPRLVQLASLLTRRRACKMGTMNAQEPTPHPPPRTPPQPPPDPDAPPPLIDPPPPIPIPRPEPPPQRLKTKLKVFDSVIAFFAREAHMLLAEH